MRKLESYVKKYGPVAGPKLYHALQSQAAHAGVSARRKRTIEALTRQPLFPERASARRLPAPAPSTAAVEEREERRDPSAVPVRL